MSKQIVVKQRTWDRLRKHGNMGDSFDKVINDMLDHIEGKK